MRRQGNIIINDKEQVKSQKDEGNYEALYNKENTNLTQIDTLDETVWSTFVIIRIFFLLRSYK